MAEQKIAGTGEDVTNRRNDSPAWSPGEECDQQKPSAADAV
jgi:hypothetical protein